MGAVQQVSSNFFLYAPGGVGQGTTTRAFGESEGTLYAGGGGGGHNGAGGEFTAGGVGGSGGGGNGGCRNYLTINAFSTPGAVNTGGGGGGAAGGGVKGSDGGSGVAIIRWGY